MPAAEIIAIGTEILLGDIVDTNSQALGKSLAKFGIDHKQRTTVGDHLERCTRSIANALERADIVFTIGGLGPTVDDVTRDAIAAAVGESLVVDEPSLRSLKKYVAVTGRPWRESYERQAMRPEGAVCLPNASGTAPGIHWEKDGKHVIAMPGPRNEFLQMLDASVEPILETMSSSVIHSRTLRILGIPESALGEMFAEEMERHNPTLSPYAKVGEVHLRLSAKAPSIEEAERMIAPTLESIRSKLGDAVYSDVGADLAEVIVSSLADGGMTVAVAESCTGGLLGGRITSVPGASQVFAGGVVSYSDRVKTDMLGVNLRDLKEHGAVSSVVAEQMAVNVRNTLGSTYGLSVTGIAGPGGGTDTKPVGLVYVGLAGPNRCVTEEHRLRGSRDHIRELSVQRALALLYREMQAS